MAGSLLGSLLGLVFLGCALAAPKLEIGDTGYARTVLQGDRLIEIPVEYLGTLKDIVGPGYDLHLVKLQGPVGEGIGVAAGMSGSPVYFAGEMLGALAYRFGSLPKEAIAGVTPLENMIDAARSPAGAVPATDATVQPITTPVMAVGLLPEVRAWLKPRLEQHGLVLVAGGEAGVGAGEAAPLVPGSAVGVQLVRGDVSIAATGTVTRVDGDRVLAFGHPFLGSGRVDMPMVSAEVVHTLADLAGSFKMSNIGNEIGAIHEDRLNAVVGRIGAKAAMIPVRMHLAGGDYHERTYDYEVVRNSTMAPLMAATAMVNSLQRNNGQYPDSTVRLSGFARFRGLPDLPLEFHAAGGGGANPNFEVALGLFNLLSALWNNPFREPPLLSLDLEVQVRPEITRYTLTDVRFDRRPLRPGQELELMLELHRYRGKTEHRRMVVPLPPGLPTDRPLVLAVGDPTLIERSLGTPLIRRLNSSPDFAAMLRVLADVPPANRVRAVIYEAGRAVASRGEVYTDLPPNAQRLLSTETASVASRRALEVTPLQSVELDLDGPVSGGTRIRLTIDGRWKTAGDP